MELFTTRDDQTDHLTRFVYEVRHLDAAAAYRELVVHGEGNPRAKQLLADATPEKLLMSPPRHLDEARGLLAGLWLWHDWLDESHAISQGIESATGSFWHAIMHRREGDFSNSKYWYAKAKGHRILPAISARMSTLINPLPFDKSLLKLVHQGWSPEAFVDLVEEVNTMPDDPRREIVVALQQAEWRMLFDHCAREAW